MTDSSVLTAKRRAQAEAIASAYTTAWKCCQRKQCFKCVNNEKLREDAAGVLVAGNKEQNRFLRSLYHEQAAVFIYDERAVCYEFLTKDFHFSREIIGKI